ncbi:glycosyltransferase, partial [Actinosynnema sp.]
SEVVPFGGSLPPLLNRLSYLPLRWFQVGGAEVDRWRADLGLPKRRGRHDRSRTATGEPVPFVHGISPLVVPPAPDWPANAHTSGFWRLPPAPDWSPPPSLADFLDRDPKPVFIGFGSIVSRDPEDTARVIREAVSRAGVRAVVRLEANIDADALGPDVLPAGEAPYDWLFPRVAAIVHGGGVGTVNDALASGVPQVPVPHTSEQEVWCRIAHRLGVATEPFRQRDLDVDRLATALRAATGDEGLARAARSVGERVRAEDGAGTAAALVERYGLDRAATR